MVVARAQLRDFPSEDEARPPRSHPAAGAGDAPLEASQLEDLVFALVYKQMHVLVGRWASEFDDLVQTASEQALRSLSSFRQEAELSTWTYRICYRTVLRHRRSYRRWLKRFSPEPLAAEPSDGAAAVSARLEQRERARRLHRALDRLSDKRRAVIVLRELEGMDTASIAGIVGASEATVRSRLRDARKQLSRALRADPYFGDEACRDGRSEEEENR